ncbi:MAG: hypothetical protein ACPHQ9_04980 [Marinobacter sp.]|uniref:hypothetical protein n=1 Tax=Marinobacter sp. TaxID=50741 RepID=UPI003C33C8D5
MWLLSRSSLDIAYLLAFPIGFDREEQGPRIGLIGGGAIGVAMAYHHLEIAIALSALNFFTLRYMGRLVLSVTGEAAEVQKAVGSDGDEKGKS